MMGNNKEKIKALLQNRGVYWRDVIKVAEVGSTAHGISTGETKDDYDYTVVRIEDYEELILGSPKLQSMMIRTQPEGVRSRMGDIDLQVYTLRKFAHLASRGNPSILTALFSLKVVKDFPAVNFPLLIGIIPTKQAGDAFLGYMRQQIERWIGIRGQKNVNRPELVEAYGFDTKYAAHVIRLGYQGIQYMEEGRFDVPMAPDQAQAIQNLRTGSVKEYDAMEWAKNLEENLKEAIDQSPLPDHPATAAVNQWTLEQYRDLGYLGRHYQGRRQSQ